MYLVYYTGTSVFCSWNLSNLECYPHSSQLLQGSELSTCTERMHQYETKGTRSQNHIDETKQEKHEDPKYHVDKAKHNGKEQSSKQGKMPNTIQMKQSIIKEYMQRKWQCPKYHTDEAK